jgi:hypothetical protein
MRKFMTIAIPSAALVLFVLIMISGSWLKNSLGQGSNISDNMDSLKSSILEERWDETEKGIRELEDNWNRVVKRIQFSVERDEIIFFNSNVARLKGAVLAKDKAGSLVELYEALDHFSRLGE